jgi:predicted transcriptional regulator of viral defense system
MRRRLGKAHLGRDLEDQPAKVALVANLLHADYVRILCGSIDNLPNAFTALDQTALDNATPLQRTKRNSELNRQVQYLLEQELTRVDVAPLPTNVAESRLNPTVV